LGLEFDLLNNISSYRISGKLEGLCEGKVNPIRSDQLGSLWTGLGQFLSGTYR